MRAWRENDCGRHSAKKQRFTIQDSMEIFYSSYFLKKFGFFLSRQDSLDRDSFENVESGAYQSRQLRDVSPSVVAIPLVVGASFGD